MSDPILDIGAAGLETTDEKVKSLVNRMVNAETPGFKSSDVTVRSFPLELEAAQNKLNSQKPTIDGTFYNHIQGSLIRTGKNTDLVIGTPGFFVLSCPWGEGYTRDGRFSIDKEGRIVSTAGNFPLLGTNGPITVNSSGQIQITETGQIIVDSVPIEKIRVVDFDEKQSLESVNGVIFRDSGKNISIKEIESPKIGQGYIEASNAKVIDQMMDLIYLNRLYNLDAKIISMRDASMAKAMEIGRIQ